MTYVIYDDDGFNAKSGRLTYEAIERFMIKPTIDLMLNSILDNKNCNEAQSAINIAFLENRETLISDYVALYDYDLSPDTSDYECDCEGVCERQCMVNAVVSYNFKEIVRQFEAAIDDDVAELDYVTDEYTEEDFMRIRQVAYDVTRILLYRELGRWAFYNGAYETGISYNSVALLIYGGATAQTNFDPSEYIENELYSRAKKANEARWQGHVEKLRRKYLELDQSRQGNADRKPTIKAVAQWIYQHHNEEELELETIRDHLSKARRGIFTND